MTNLWKVWRADGVDVRYILFPGGRYQHWEDEVILAFVAGAYFIGLVAAALFCWFEGTELDLTHSPHSSRRR